MSTVELKVVDQQGAVVATLDNVVGCSPLTDVLNRAGGLSFALHNLDPQAALVEAIAKEVQVWRNGSLLADGGWVVPITPESRVDGHTDTVEFECRGLFWHLDRRFFGDADRRDYLDGAGLFEGASIAPFTATGTTASLDTTRKVNGAASAKLVQAAAGTDTYIARSVSIAAGGVGALMTVAGWFFASSTGWVGEASGGRGLFLQRSVGGVVQDFDFAELNNGEDEGVPLDVWQRREVEVHIPPNTTEDIEVRLYSPGGSIWWDEVTLTAMDSVSFYETDQATIADGIVVHAQDAAYGKSDLNIGRTTPATGITRDRHYQHAEHPNIGRSLAEFTTLDDGFDQSIALTPTMRTYTLHYPRKGTARAALSWDEIVRVRWVPVEGEQAANSIVVLGDGDGPDREEGAAVDTSAFGGVTLEEVIAAPTGTPIDGLDSKAAEELRVRTNARRLEVTLGPGLRVGSMAVGDTFDGPAAIPGRYTDLSGSWRVVQTALDLVSDCLSITAEAE